MDTEIRHLEKRAINDPSQILRLIVAQRRAGKMIFKNSRGLEILNQCTGAHSEKFNIKHSTRVEYGQDFPAPLNKDKDTHRTWVFLDVDFSEKDGEKDTIKLYMQIGSNSILVEKVYTSDPDAIEKMAQRVNSLVSSLSNGQGI